MKAEHCKIIIGVVFILGGISSKDKFTQAVGFSLLMNGLIEFISKK
jgi:uncharacterized membrane protein HdeD (DUF308 family)